MHSKNLSTEPHDRAGFAIDARNPSAGLAHDSNSSSADLAEEANKTQLGYAFEANGKRISSDLFYQLACEPERNVVVEACAGAGKTWILVSRMLRILLLSAQQAKLAKLESAFTLQPQQIIAITFTKKAASEMQERLMELLRDFSLMDTAKTRENLLLRGVAAGEVDHLIPLAQALYKQVLASPRQPQVRTFHGWFATLLKSAPLAVLQGLGLPTQYELQEDQSLLLQKTWQRFYQLLSEDAALRQDFAYLCQHHGRSGCTKLLEAVLDKHLEFRFADDAGVLGSSVLPWQEQFRSYADAADFNSILNLPGIKSHLEAAQKNLAARTGKKLSEAAASHLANALQIGDANLVCDALLAKTGKRNGNLPKVEELASAYQLAEDLYQIRLQIQATELQTRTTRLARHMLQVYAALKRDEAWLDMGDVERAAYALLSNQVLAGVVQERLDAQTKHLLIDEFQDTNPLQWQALYSWLSAYAGAGGGKDLKVFIVGDPKQSIYRFRRAQPEVFGAAKAFVQDALDGVVLSCDHTRRNAPAIIEVVNAVMLQAQSQERYSDFRPHSTASSEQGGVWHLPEIERIKKAKTPSQSKTKQHANANASAGEAELSTNLSTDLSTDLSAELAEDLGDWRDTLTSPKVEDETKLADLEAEQVARCIQQLLEQGAAASEVMVLARTRKPLEHLHERLKHHHIVSQITEKSQLADAPEVRDILALLDMLCSPSQALAMAQVLKSPLFGLDDVALMRIAVQVKTQNAAQRRSALAWWQAVAALYPEIFQQLKRWQHWLQSLPPHDALAAIYADADVLARFVAIAPAPLKAQTVQNLSSLLAATLAAQGGRFLDAYNLVRELKKNRIANKMTLQADAVQLLTIHGAKGLEADTVILMDSQRGPPKNESMTLLCEWPGQQDHPSRFAFIAAEKEPPPSLQAVLVAEKNADTREALNLLYVAMTRAKRQLIISSVEPQYTLDDSWWSRIFPHSQPWLFSADTSSDGVPTPVAESIYRLDELPELSNKLRDEARADGTSTASQGAAMADDFSVATARGATSSTAANSRASRIGQALHRLLEWGDAVFPETQPANAKLQLPSAVAQTISQRYGLNLSELAAATHIAQRIRYGEAAWCWDQAQITWAGNEVELNHQGQSLRIDRLVQRRDTGAWWVLDYKSAQAPELQSALRQQLASYAAALQAAKPQARVHAAFINANGNLIELQ